MIWAQQGFTVIDDGHYEAALISVGDGCSVSTGLVRTRGFATLLGAAGPTIFAAETPVVGTSFGSTFGEQMLIALNREGVVLWRNSTLLPDHTNSSELFRPTAVGRNLYAVGMYDGHRQWVVLDAVTGSVATAIDSGPCLGRPTLAADANGNVYLAVGQQVCKAVVPLVEN